MKILIAMLMVVMCWQADKAPTSPVNDLTGCSIINSSGNTPNFQDMSETYHCDQGDVTLHGKWGMTVEYGTIYRDNMGRQSDKTEPATEFDRDFFQWCRKDSRQIVLCGDKEARAHSSVSLLPWYPNANDYPQVKGAK